MPTAEGNNLFVSYSFDVNACIFKTNVSLNTNVILNSKGMLKFSIKAKTLYTDSRFGNYFS